MTDVALLVRVEDKLLYLLLFKLKLKNSFQLLAASIVCLMLKALSSFASSFIVLLFTKLSVLKQGKQVSIQINLEHRSHVSRFICLSHFFIPSRLEHSHTNADIEPNFRRVRRHEQSIPNRFCRLGGARQPQDSLECLRQQLEFSGTLVGRPQGHRSCRCHRPSHSRQGDDCLREHHEPSSRKD